MATSIKVGDYFRVSNVGDDGRIFCCTKLSEENGILFIWDGSRAWRAETCERIRIRIFPLKSHSKVKLSSLQAWHRSKWCWVVRAAAGDNRGVETLYGGGICIGTGPTEAKAIIALRKALRAKGVKL